MTPRLDELTRQPLRPYEVLFSHDRWTSRTRDAAREIMEDGWKLGTLPRAPLRPPVPWQTLGASHRSWNFHLHCWDALGPVLSTYDHEHDLDCLRFAVELAVDWAEQHPTINTADGFAWYDMAIGVRAYRLAYIIDAAAREQATDPAHLHTLLKAVDNHLAALADNRNFAAHSNHGFYFAAGQLALAGRLSPLGGMEPHIEQGRKRLYTLVETQFSREGVHREHSPDYHRMVWETFDGLIRAGLLSREDFGPLSDTIQEALAWFITPQGRLAMFGDTPAHHMLRTDDRIEELQNDALRFVCSRGETAQPPSETMRVFPESGYAVIRSGWSQGDDATNDSYLAQIAAFHSRTHKHADDLSIIWHDRGHEILIDPGRFGYLERTDPKSELARKGFYYAHPSRMYVESTRAHNTVEIDNESLPRRGVKPSGSAIERTGQVDGLSYIETHVRHHRSIRHARVLVFSPGAWLLIYDWLWDNNKQNHDFTQWFQFAPELSLGMDEGRISAALPDAGPDAGPTLHLLSMLDGALDAPMHGRNEPDLQGWISRKDNELTPAWSVANRVKGRPTAQFAMLFSFGQSPPTLASAQTITTGRDLSFAWNQDDTRHALRILRPDGKPFKLTYSVR